ncbi:periplasmic binding protein-like I [Powellomyces hirtus]|nr:periplasmic binding protein-like I [Powellomyces hirtus]
MQSIVSIRKLCVASFVSALTISNAFGATIKIGVSLPFSGDDAEWSQDAFDVMSARLDGLMQGPAVHPQLAIELIQLDNVGSINIPTIASSIASGINASTLGLTAMIGVGYSDATMGLAPTAHAFGLPLCDGASTSPTLSSKMDFPNFFRTVPDDNVAGEAIINLIAANGWSKLALIASTDSSGTGLLEAARNAAKDLNLDVLAVQTFVPNQKDFSTLLKGLQSSGATIFAYLGLATDLVHLLNEAGAQGMVTEGYQWITSPDALYLDILSLDAEQLMQWHGLWALAPREGTGSLFYDEFLPHYRQAYYPGDPSKVPNVYTTFYASCVEMYFYAFNESLYRNVLPSDLNVPSDFSFPERFGVAGNLGLDENGNSMSAFDIFYFNGSQEANSAASFVNFGSWDKAVTTQFGYKVGEKAPVFYAGAVERPKDALQILRTRNIVEVSSGLGVFTIILFVLSVLAVLMLMYVVIREKNNPIIKATSPPFLMITLAGILLGSTYPLTFLGSPTRGACISAAWIVPTALGAVIGSMLVKTLRLLYIFRHQGARKMGFQNKDMSLWFCAIMSVYLIIVLVWTVANPPVPVDEIHKIVNPTWIISQEFCSSSTDSFQLGMLGALIAYTVLLLLIGGFMAFVTRKLPPPFNEAKSLGYVMCAYAGILAFVMPVLFLLDLDYAGFVLVKIVATYGAVIFTAAMLFGKKCYSIWQEKRDQSSNDLLKGGVGKQQKDEMTESWMVKSIVKAANMSGTVWVADKQSFISYWAEQTLVLFADRGIALLTGGDAKGSNGTACQCFPLRNFELSTASNDDEGIYTIKLTHTKNATANLTFRVESADEMEKWTSQMSKLCPTRSGTMRKSQMSTSVTGSVDNRIRAGTSMKLNQTRVLEEDIEHTAQ